MRLEAIDEGLEYLRVLSHFCDSCGCFCWIDKHGYNQLRVMGELKGYLSNYTCKFSSVKSVEAEFCDDPVLIRFTFVLGSPKCFYLDTTCYVVIYEWLVRKMWYALLSIWGCVVVVFCLHCKFALSVVGLIFGVRKWWCHLDVTDANFPHKNKIKKRAEQTDGEKKERRPPKMNDEQQRTWKTTQETIKKELLRRCNHISIHQLSIGHVNTYYLYLPSSQT